MNSIILSTIITINFITINLVKINATVHYRIILGNCVSTASSSGERAIADPDSRRLSTSGQSITPRAAGDESPAAKTQSRGRTLINRDALHRSAAVDFGAGGFRDSGNLRRGAAFCAVVASGKRCIIDRRAGQESPRGLRLRKALAEGAVDSHLGQDETGLVWSILSCLKFSAVFKRTRWNCDSGTSCLGE